MLKVTMALNGHAVQPGSFADTSEPAALETALQHVLLNHRMFWRAAR
jgi:hypothetical protein